MVYIRISGKNAIRKNVMFGCFCIAWPENKTTINQEMGLTFRIAQKGLDEVKDNGCR